MSPLKALPLEALVELDSIAKTTRELGRPTELAATLWGQHPWYASLVRRRYIGWRRARAGSLMREVWLLPAGRAALAVAEPAVREAVREACAAKLEADAEKYRSAAVNAYFAETAQTNDAVAEAIDSEAAAIRAGGPEHG